MKWAPISELEGGEKLADVHRKITPKIIEALQKCLREERDINWEDLKEYCIELFTLPEVTIDRAIDEARRKLDI